MPSGGCSSPLATTRDHMPGSRVRDERRAMQRVRYTRARTRTRTSQAPAARGTEDGQVPPDRAPPAHRRRDAQRALGAPAGREALGRRQLTGQRPGLHHPDRHSAGTRNVLRRFELLARAPGARACTCTPSGTRPRVSCSPRAPTPRSCRSTWATRPMRSPPTSPAASVRACATRPRTGSIRRCGGDGCCTSAALLYLAVLTREAGQPFSATRL